MKPVLRRDDEHRYFLGAEELWGVSAVLKDNGLIDDRWFDETSSSRGLAIHAELSNVARGIAPFSFIEPDLFGWCQSGYDFLDMLRADGHEIIGIAVMLYHNLYRFAGEYDLLTKKEGREYLYDFKSGKASKATRFQIAAYDLLLGPTKDGKPRKRAAVELQQDGDRARVLEYNSPDNFHDGNTFLALLTAARTRQQFGPKNV